MIKALRVPPSRPLRSRTRRPAHTCCELVTANLGTPGIALTTNTQYWLVAMTDDINAPDFEGVWAFTNFAFVVARDIQLEAGWGTGRNGGASAGAVKGLSLSPHFSGKTRAIHNKGLRLH
jgi:hypothetical protein